MKDSGSGFTELGMADMNSKIQLQTASIVVCNEESLYSEIGEEMLVLNEEAGSCFTLNSTASRIWQLLEKPQSLDNLVDILMEEYQVDRDDCMKEVRSVIHRLIDKGVVKLAEV